MKSIKGNTVLDFPQTVTDTIFEGTVTVTAPDVTLDACGILGQSAEDILLTMGVRTKLVNCDLFGSVHGAHRGIRTDGREMLILNTRVKNIWSGLVSDTQALGGWDGCNGLLVKGCELEAAGEVIMFGGSTMSRPENKPTNITIDDCLLTRKIEWRNKTGGETNKNLFELKNCKNLTLSNCVMQYSWIDGQIGWALVLTTRQDPFPYSSIENIDIFNNRIMDVANCVSIQGHDNSTDDPRAGSLRNVKIRDNDFSGISSTQWGVGDASLIFQILRGSDNLSILRNRFRGDEGNVFNSFLNFGGGFERYKNNGLVLSGNDAPAGLYGIIGEGSQNLGVETLNDYAPGYVWGHNVIHGKESNPYCVWPEGTC